MTEHPDLQPLDESTFETVLCVVAHPDDLEYGTAAAVDRWVRAGKTVTYLLATRGEAGIDTLPPEQAAPLREQEERDGAGPLVAGPIVRLGRAKPLRVDDTTRHLPLESAERLLEGLRGYDVTRV